MKNYLLGFLTACTIMLSVLSAALIWVLWIYHKATKRRDEHADYSKYTEHVDYSKYTEHVDEQD